MSMETYNFELRIFANIAGFEEIRFGNPDTLSAGLVNNDVLDSKRGMFPTGTFVVFYDEAVYAIVKLVEAPAEAKYRDSRAYICVAVRRGYRLNNAKQVLDKLDEEFYKQASLSKEDVANALSKGKAELNRLVNDCIEADSDQPVYPVSANQAVVSYQSDEELEDILDHPIRKELANFRALYILSQEVAAAKWPVLKDSGFSPISGLDHPYRRTYLLCYPNGEEDTITGLEQEVKRVCTRSHCAPLTFKGKLKDHVEDWKITLNAEKTVYTIGREFEPERKIYTVVAEDERGNAYAGLTYVASVGTFKEGTLVLTGKEIEQRPNLALQNRPDLKIVAQEVVEDALQIVVKIAMKNQYDVTTLWEIVENTVGHKQDFSITLVNTQTGKEVSKFSKKKLSVYSDLPYDQAAYKVGKTKKYQECMVFLKSDGTLGEFKLQENESVMLPMDPKISEKKMLKVTIRIENSRLRQELDSEKKKVRLDLKYRDSSYVEKEDIKFINKSSYSFEIPSDVLIWFTLQARGYKKCTFEKDYIHRDTPKEGNEDVIPVTFKKLPYKKIAVLVLMPLACLLVGFVLGTWIGKKQVKGVDEKQYVKLAEYEKLEAENNRLKQANDELFGENEGLKTRLQELAIDPKAGGGSSDVIDQQRNELIEKLKGTDFTQADIDELKNPNQEEQYLIEDCDACLRLLYATTLNDKKNAQKNIKEESGWYYSKLYEKIKIQAHKDAMYEIILGDYEGAFTTVDIIRNNPNRSIANAIQKYKENMGN